MVGIEYAATNNVQQEQHSPARSGHGPPLGDPPPAYLPPGQEPATPFLLFPDLPAD